jgi:hypothetical protein
MTWTGTSFLSCNFLQFLLALIFLVRNILSGKNIHSELSGIKHSSNVNCFYCKFWTLLGRLKKEPQQSAQTEAWAWGTEYGEEKKVCVKKKLSSLYKVKFFLVHTLKACWGNRGIDPPILNLGPRWRWVANFTPWPFYPRETTPAPTAKEAEGASEPVWTFYNNIY